MAPAVTLLLAFALLTSWVRHPAPLAIAQIGILTTGGVWLIAATIRRWPIVLRPVLLPLAGVIVLALVQMWTGRTAYAWETAGQALNWTVHLTAAFLLLQALMHYPRREQWLTACAVFAIAVSLIAILQLFTSPGKVFWYFDSGYRDLVLGPFVYHNRYAQFVELLMPVVLYRAFTDRQRAPLWLLGAGVLFAGVIASVSRAGVVLVAIEIFVVLGCAVWQRYLKRRTMLVAAGQIVGVALVWGTVAGWSGVLDRLLSLNPLEDWRVSYYESTIAMIRDFPVLGCGLGAWTVVYPQYALFDPGLFVNAAHNDWLQWTAEGGAAMLLLMCAFALLVTRPALRSVWGAGLPVVMAHAMIDYPFQDAAFASAVFAFSGAVAAEHLTFLRSQPYALWVQGGSSMVKRVSVLPVLCGCMIWGAATMLPMTAALT